MNRIFISIFDILCSLFDNNQSQEKSLYVKRVRALRIPYMNAKIIYKVLIRYSARLLRDGADLFSVFGDFN